MAGVGVADLRSLGFPLALLVGAGFGMAELKQGGVGAAELVRTLNNSFLTSTSCSGLHSIARAVDGMQGSLRALREAGLKLWDLRSVADLQSLMTAGFSVSELV